MESPVQAGYQPLRQIRVAMGIRDAERNKVAKSVSHASRKAALSQSESTKATGKWVGDMDSEEQYELIRELLEPEFGPLYVTPPDIDETVKQLSFTISEGIHRAVF